ncbi:hypothetical protein ACWDZ8_11820 [Streptomyces sp. NPDC003233]
MTSTPTSPRTAARAGRGGFGPLLHAEWTKFRTVHGWWVSSIGAVLVICLVGLLATAAGNAGAADGSSSLPVGPGGEAVDDNFYFVHQPLTGDGTITVAVSSLTGRIATGPGHSESGLAPWAKAGIIVKDGLDQGSSYAAMMVTGSHGVRMQYDYTHDIAGAAGAASAQSPRRLRLRRNGDVLTGYQSTDGSNWTEVGTARLAGLSDTAQVGLFVTSRSAEQSTGTGSALAAPPPADLPDDGRPRRPGHRRHRHTAHRPLAGARRTGPVGPRRTHRRRLAAPLPRRMNGRLSRFVCGSMVAAATRPRSTWNRQLNPCERRVEPLWRLERETGALACPSDADDPEAVEGLLRTALDAHG